MGDLKIDYITIDILKDTIKEMVDLKDYNDFRNIIKKINITITEEEVRKYLTIKRRENIEEDRILKTSDRLAEYMMHKNNTYNPFAFHYYKKCMIILKEKINKLLDIVDNIENIFNNKFSKKEKIEFINYLKELDILINQKTKEIKKEDAIRLITPILENYDKLKELENRANKIESYIGFRLTDRFATVYGLTEHEIYPDISLQTKNVSYYMSVKSEYGYIPLTERQKNIKKNKN